MAAESSGCCEETRCEAREGDRGDVGNAPESERDEAEVTKVEHGGQEGEVTEVKTKRWVTASHFSCMYYVSIDVYSSTQYTCSTHYPALLWQRDWCCRLAAGLSLDPPTT